MNHRILKRIGALAMTAVMVFSFAVGASAANEADAIIDTSSFNHAQLAAEISNIVSSGKDDRTFTVNIMSFGYKNGMPVSADMVFDASFLPNPFYVEELKHKTGNDPEVREYVMGHDIARLFAEEVRGMIEILIPFYKQEGKFSLSVCFGCTGGHHRSVTLANELSERLTAKGIRTTLEHRDL